MAAEPQLAQRAQAEVTRRDQRPEFFCPAVDVSEIPDGLVLKYDMPGVSKEHVDITVEKGTLRVTGMTDPEESGTAVYRETRVGHYRREFSLADDVDADHIQADMRAGVLTIHIAKPEKAKPKRIAITNGQ